MQLLPAHFGTSFLWHKAGQGVFYVNAAAALEVDMWLAFELSVLLTFTCWLARSYKVELNEDITARISDLRAAEQGGEDIPLEAYREVLHELTRDSEYQDLTGEVMVDEEGLIVTQGEGSEPSAPNCSAFHGCDECIEGGCAWCLSARSCKPDEAWQCQGQEDHVGYGGIGDHTSCPTAEEIDERRRERRARRAEAREDALKKKEKEKELEQKEKLKRMAGIDGDLNPEEEEAAYDKIERYNDLLRRSQLAEEEYGSRYPYETLGVDSTSSSNDIRKAYRKLSVMFHPDKNPGEEEKALADLAFKDIVAAHDILSDPEKRAIFDDMGGAEAPESFNSQAAYEEYGKKNHDNFYGGHKFIHPLTESLWERRVGSGDTVWLIEFYAPWCGACQSFIPTFKQIAERLAEDHSVDVEVGSVNCETNKAICGDWFGIRSYPTLLAVNDKHGTRQEYQGAKSVGDVTSWIKKVAKEWKWLFVQSDIITMTSKEEFNKEVVDSEYFWVVVFMDGFDCSACKTAKTNAMRLSASLRGYHEDVQVGMVDCEEPDAFELCYGEEDGQGLPSRPHAPVVKGYGSGAKPQNTRGEILYNTNEVEPHIALEMLDHTIRLVLSDRLNNTSAVGMANDGSYAENEKDEKDEKKEPDSPPEPMWNGPTRRTPIAWGGTGGQIPNRPMIN